MQRYRKLTTFCAVAVLSLALAACGGGNGGDDQTMVTPPPEPPPPPPPPMVYPTALPDGHGLNPGMTIIPAGTTAMLASGTHIACGGTEDCTLTISVESVTGALSASSTGGMVSVSTAASRLAALHATNQQTLASAREALADLDAMDPGDVTANQRAAAEMALANALALPGNEGAPENQPPPTPEPPPAPPTPVAVTVPDAMYLDAANMPVAGSMTIAAGAMETSGGVTFLCAEGGDACEVTVADDGSVSATGGTVTASLTAAAMTQVAASKEMKSDEMLAMRDRLIGKDAALEGASNLAIGIAATETPSVLQESEIIITRGAGKAARVRVGPTGPGGYGVADTPAMANGDWAGTHLTRVAGAATQHLFVYTDIGPPTRQQFYDFDAKASTPTRYVYPGTLPVDTNGNQRAFLPTDTISPLSLVAAGTAAPGLFTGAVLDPIKFNSPGPEGDGDKSQRFIGSTTGGAAGAPGLSFKGNYNGAPGTYTCTAAAAQAATGDCTVTIPETGSYSSTATWTFTPELNATAWQNDGEFMSFGWWMQEPNSANGAYTFQYYADGTPFAATATVPSGTATYTGRAAGKYVVQTIEDGGVTGGMAGQFTAAATLTANFDAQTGAGVAAPTIEGSITGFQSDQQHDVSGWQVTLHRNSFTLAASTAGPADIAAQGQLDPARPSYDGVTATMGDQTAYGDWSAQFFGNAMTATGNPVNAAQPLGVGGTFQADNDEASIAGAFGARR